MSSSWPGLAALLSTNPLDVGCEQTWQLVDCYVEAVLAGHDPEAAYPGITAHLESCHPCAEDYRGLLAVLSRVAEPRVG